VLTPTSFAELEYFSKKTPTPRERFLAEIEAVGLWAVNQGIEDAVYDRQAIRRFVSIDLTREDTPPMPLHT
jgi:IS5 family transposase